MRLPKGLLNFFRITFFVLELFFFLPAAGVLPEGFGGWLLTLVVVRFDFNEPLAKVFLADRGAGPEKHALAGGLYHLACHRRPERLLVAGSF